MSPTDCSELVDMDHAATTALCDESIAAMEPFLMGTDLTGRGRGRYGNPSGSHALARDAVRALDEAREQVATVLGCEPGEVVFTSGGTEADNHAVTGGMPPRRGTPVCSAVEHPAVLRPTQALGGATVAVDRFGRVDLTALAETIRTIGDGHTGGSYTGGSYTGGSYTENSRAPGVSVVSVMTANNELGTINDISAVAEVVRRHAPGVPLHTDAVQAAPWLDLRSVACEADLVSVSAHKLGGPKGTGALVVRRPHTLAPLLHGGGQERDRRGGTHNVAGIVGFAAALIAAARRRPVSVERIGALRDSLAQRLVALDGVTETIDRRKASTLPGHCHLLVRGVVGEELLLLLEQRGVCASAASSCASGAIGASHVLEAIGVVDPDVAPVRLTLGADSTPAEVDRAVETFTVSLDRVRSRSRRGAAGGAR